MADLCKFKYSMEKCKVPPELIEEIMNVEYIKDENIKQDNANFAAKAMAKCDELLGFDMTAKIMYEKACCKSGLRLENAYRLNKEHGNKPLKEKLKLLGQLKNMGHPYLNEDGDIVSDKDDTQHNYPCPCWNFDGCKPVGEVMPLSYCLCCGGHFRFHYEKALKLKLKIKEVKSSILNSNGEKPCIFVYKII